MKRFNLLLLAVCFVFAAAAAVAITQESLETRAGPVERASHGTHLCTADSDCGTDHKCCSGHCKWVDTCG